jgi:hypothetical protein
MNQIARNLTDSVDGLLTEKRYLIHDRDPLFTHEFPSTLKDAGVQSVKLPPRSPNLNAYAERLVRSIKESVWSGSSCSVKVRCGQPFKISSPTITMNAITKA